MYAKNNYFFMHVLTRTNEKYKGDALLQKRYTVDFLSKKKKVNKGEAPQYYVEGSHYAIIEPSVFDAVQKQMAVRHPGKNRESEGKAGSGQYGDHGEAGQVGNGGAVPCGDCKTGRHDFRI